MKRLETRAHRRSCGSRRQPASPTFKQGAAEPTRFGTDSSPSRKTTRLFCTTPGSGGPNKWTGRRTHPGSATRANGTNAHRATAGTNSGGMSRHRSGRRATPSPSRRASSEGSGFYRVLRGSLRWSRLFGQFSRFDKRNVCRGWLGRQADRRQAVCSVVGLIGRHAVKARVRARRL